MNRILFVLLLLIAATAPAQEIRGPFVIPVDATDYGTAKIASVNGDTIGVLSMGNVSGVSYWAYSVSAESLIVHPIQIVTVPDGWYSINMGPVQLSDGWVALTYQVKNESHFDYGYNRLIMIYEQYGQIISVVLDSGRTHEYWIDSLSRMSSYISLTSRMDGGFYTSRNIEYAERDSAGNWSMLFENEIREYEFQDSGPVYRQSSCTGSYLSGPADSLFLLHFYTEDEHGIRGCIATRDTTIQLPAWENCIIQLYDVMYTRERGLRLLTGYSPVLQLKQLSLNGNCELISEIEAVAEFVVSHPNYGYVLITRTLDNVLIGQLDLDGQLIRTPVPVNIDANQLFDMIVTGNGDTYLLWGDWPHSGYYYNMLIIPWDALLEAPDGVAPVVPHDPTLFAYPNPFNSTVTIQYDLPQAAQVKLTAYDLQGRVVATISDEFAVAGSKTLRWSPENLASGVYFLNLETALAHTTHKILYLK